MIPQDKLDERYEQRRREALGEHAETLDALIRKGSYSVSQAMAAAAMEQARFTGGDPIEHLDSLLEAWAAEAVEWIEEAQRHEHAQRWGMES